MIPKISTLTIEEETLLERAVLFLVQGILVGLMVVIKKDDYNVTIPFTVANTILIPAIARRLFREKNTEEKL